MDFEEDIEKILLSRETEEAFFKRLCSHTSNFRSELLEYTNKRLDIHNEQKMNHEINKNVKEQLDDDLRNLESSLEKYLLQQKVLNKQISAGKESEENLKKDIEELKIKKEEYALNMVDLERELEENKKSMKKEHNAINMANGIYKEHLNIYIDFEEIDDHDNLKITFFYDKNQDKDSYYIECSNYDSTWKIFNIKPSLKEEHLREIQLDFNADYDIHDMTAFLCKIRYIFLKNYDCKRSLHNEKKV
ncbi:hypothetical protein HCN44_009334 [Aphidius gifuensis]|uniref:Kinetochore protein SPC25 n=1 Tax=Aphidius gifuensis TaxID=684658 RepID=A0A834Y7D4_APHGI|nr:GRIP and coiled-coil domain-containing protein 2-like [Aphidius gifuensis]KAF7997936.1 hypothetical protein HCN44_009334 [Aphidius gifuensis]